MGKMERPLITITNDLKTRAKQYARERAAKTNKPCTFSSLIRESLEYFMKNH